jgi:methanogenic corrinoid protein MtbC1
LEHGVPDHLARIDALSGLPRQLAERADKRVISAAEIEEITEVFLVSDPGAFISVLEKLGLHQLTFAEFYRGIIQPVAETLGTMWCDDRAGFLAVSIATERLRLAVDTLYSDTEVMARHPRRSALVTCHDNSNHTFGAFLLAKAFVFSDWLVETRNWNDPAGSPFGHIARHHFDFLGLSVGTSGTAQALAKSIATLRAKSLNTKLVIGVGGVGPALDPEGFSACGADFVSVDAVDAVLKAEAAVNRAHAVSPVYV